MQELAILKKVAVSREAANRQIARRCLVFLDLALSSFSGLGHAIKLL
jgi:hypothetical protein